MPFKVILRGLVESVSSATGAILAEWEGEAVEHYCLYDEYELKIIAAHKGIILDRMKDAHAALPGGGVRDAVIETDTQLIVIGGVGPEYSLVMTLDKSALVGNALYHFRKTLKLLEKEIY